jgi:ATP-binding protein involved in chromosome partitioning
MAEAPGPAPGPEQGPAFESLADARARIGARLADVERTIAVASGKGGVGKSLVAVHLALALARRGLRVALLDADLNSPSVAKMLGLRGQPLRVAAVPSQSEMGALAPIAGPLGIAVQSMDFFLQGDQPLAWDGPAGEGAPWRSGLEDAALADLLAETAWGARDVLIVDLAPGPDRLPALSHLLPSLTGALAVTIPTEVALLSLERAVRRAREARIPLVGLVENLGRTVCGACGAEGPLYREAPSDACARDLGLDVLARIPFDPALGAAADAGRPLLAAADPGAAGAAGKAFEALADRVLGWTPPPLEGDSW